MEVIIYHNPECSKSCYALEYLQKHNIDIEIRLYLETGITSAEIFDILEILKTDIREIFRSEEKIFAEKYPTNMSFSQDSLINKVIENPILLQRPIILLKEKNIGAIARSEATLATLVEFK
jgi:arsenate reductase